MVLHQLQRSEIYGNLRGAEPSRVAKVLGTSVAWVEKCAAVYGRRLQGKRVPSERREARERAWESGESEEVGREELETAGDVIVDPVPYKDKQRQRALVQREDDWQPVQRDDWKPNTGKRWSPFLVDPFRTKPDYVPGMVRQ